MNAEQKEQEFKDMKDRYMERARKGSLTDFDVQMMMNRAFSMGRYVGHCRGEEHVKRMMEKGRLARASSMIVVMR